MSKISLRSEHSYDLEDLKISNIEGPELVRIIRSAVSDFFQESDGSLRLDLDLTNNIYTSVLINLMAGFICSGNSLEEGLAEAQEFSNAITETVRLYLKDVH